MQILDRDIILHGEAAEKQMKRSRLRYVFLISVTLVLAERIAFFNNSRSVYAVLQFFVIYFLLLTFLMGRGFRKAKLLNTSTFFILLLLLFSFISLLFSIYHEAVLNSALIQFFELGALAILLYVLLANYWEDEDWATLAKLMVLLATVSSVTIITDFLEITRIAGWLGVNIYPTPTYVRASGILGEVNFAAGKLSVMLPFCFFLYSYYRKKDEKLRAASALIVVIPIMIAIFLTGSRMGMLAALFTLTYGLFYFIFSKLRGPEKKRLAFVPILAFVTVLVVLVMLLPIGAMISRSATSSKYEMTFTRYANVWAFLTSSEVTGETSITVRGDLIVFGIKKFIEKPITGFGLGAFTELSRVEFGLAIVAHNTFIEMLADTGLLGGMSFIALFAYALFNILKSKERLGIFYQAFIISSINLFIMLFFLSSSADKLLWGMFIPISMYLEQRRKEDKPLGRRLDSSPVRIRPIKWSGGI